MKTRLKLLFVLHALVLSIGPLVIGLTPSLRAQEKLVLTTPVQAVPGAAEFSVWDLYMRRGHPDREAEIRVTFREVATALRSTTNISGFVPGGRSLTCAYTGPAAELMILSLAKANLQTVSLERRVTTQCQMDKQLGSGTISGTP